MNKSLYPDNWRTLAQEIKAANHWQCQECGCQCRRPGELNLGWQFQLTIAHYDGVYEAEAVFLACLCVKCHLRHDAPFVWHSRRRRQRLRQIEAGQLALIG